MLDRLYKRTATGAVQCWDIEVDAPNGRYRMISGQLGGKAVTSEWTVAKPKNAGRANATNESEQAILEAEAAWLKKQRDGYGLTMPKDGDGAFRCMLAKEYKDPNRKLAALAAAAKGKLWSQPKLDGVRLIASEGKMMSRTNRPIVSMPHIELALRPVFAKFKGLVLDGELYTHDLKNDFDSLVSLVRKQRPGPQDLKDAERLQYWIYDCAGPGFEDLDYPYRQKVVFDAVYHVDRPLWLAPLGAERVDSEEEIDAHYLTYLQKGFEGQMLRISAPYENKRSDKLLKRKEVEDQEHMVVSIREGEGNYSGQAGAVIVEDGARLRFKAGIDGTDSHRAELLRHRAKYEGGKVTIRFNGRTPSGVPRFPRAVAWFPTGKRDV